MCNVKKVRLLDWLIRRLVRGLGEKGEWVLAEYQVRGLVCAPTLLKAAMRQVEGVRTPCNFFLKYFFSPSAFELAQRCGVYVLRLRDVW